MAKTSIKKYTAMLKGMCADSRVRGLLQYYGANRTGRWAGRLVQVQNLPQNHLPDLDLARQLVKENDLELLEMLFGNVPDTLSQLIRTSFVAPHGHKFIIADFSAIEARVIAWLAGERWRMEVFATHGKIYEASAAHMFKVPLESIVKGSDLRQKGKVAELALGYQGGPNALIAMGALKMGLQEDELPKLVSMWRNANKAIVALWEKVDDAALAAVDEPGSVHTIAHGIWFVVQKGSLWIELPSKRRLAYLNPRLRSNRFGNMAITYEGMSQTTKQWAFQETYGGKLVENIVQAIARDCLADAMLRVDDAGYKVVMHVHDEIVAEVPVEQDCIEDINRIMSTPIAWAKGLLLRADSYESLYYKKD
jgi:DNA polymerase